MKTLSTENLRDILVKIDPLDTKYKPLNMLVLKRIRKKEENCTLI